ncbi:MAG: hypothetical protein ACK42I_03510, partial [Thermomicrobium sp.]
HRRAQALGEIALLSNRPGSVFFQLLHCHSPQIFLKKSRDEFLAQQTITWPLAGRVREEFHSVPKVEAR